MHEVISQLEAIEVWQEGITAAFPSPELLEYFQEEYETHDELRKTFRELVRTLKQKCFRSWPKTLVDFELIDELLESSSSAETRKTFEKVCAQLHATPKDQSLTLLCRETVQRAQADLSAMLQVTDNPLLIEIFLKSRELTSEHPQERILMDLALTLLSYRRAFQPKLVRLLYLGGLEIDAEEIEQQHFYQLKALCQLLDQWSISEPDLERIDLSITLRNLHTLSAVPYVEAKRIREQIDSIQVMISPKLGELSDFFDVCYRLADIPSFKLLKTLKEMEIDSEDLPLFMERALEKQQVFTQDLNQTWSLNLGQIVLFEKELSKNEKKLLDRVSVSLEKEAQRKKFCFSASYDGFIQDCIELFAVLVRSRSS